MTATVVIPDIDFSNQGVILTFVVPAPRGCNLGCPFCFIRQRREDLLPIRLRPQDYVSFISEIAEERPIAAVCVQGYEPLLPESFEYTRLILEKGRRLHVPTSLVTNGTYLEEFVLELRDLQPFRIAVSLDAADHFLHDRQRRKTGAWHSAVKGLERAVAELPDTTEIVATSVLLPKRRQQLDAIPQLLRRLGVDSWVVTILQTIGNLGIGGPVGSSESILSDLKILQSHSLEQGIELHVDDEFGRIQSLADDLPEGFSEQLRVRRLKRPDGVIRLLPSGHCAIGLNIMKQQNLDERSWTPGEDFAADYVASLDGAGQAHIY